MYVFVSANGQRSSSSQYFLVSAYRPGFVRPDKDLRPQRMMKQLYKKMIFWFTSCLDFIVAQVQGGYLCLYCFSVLTFIVQSPLSALAL